MFPLLFFFSFSKVSFNISDSLQWKRHHKREVEALVWNVYGMEGKGAVIHVHLGGVKRPQGRTVLGKAPLSSLYVAFWSHWSLLAARKPQNKMRNSAEWNLESIGNQEVCSLAYYVTLSPVSILKDDLKTGQTPPPHTQ